MLSVLSGLRVSRRQPHKAIRTTAARNKHCKKGSSLVCSAVVSYDITHFRVRAAIGIRLNSAVLGSGAKKTLPVKN